MDITVSIVSALTPRASGNAVTARRLGRALRGVGVFVDSLRDATGPSQEGAGVDVAGRVNTRAAADPPLLSGSRVLVAVHAVRGGRAALRAAPGVRVVLVLGGTDVHGTLAAAAGDAGGAGGGDDARVACRALLRAEHRR